MVPSPTEVIAALRHLYAITTERPVTPVPASAADATAADAAATLTAAAGVDEPDPVSLVEDGEWERFRWRCHAKDRLEPLVEHMAARP
jgi:hypothetical protein